MSDPKILIIRKDLTPVAYYRAESDTVYWPGKNGGHMKADGMQFKSDYSNLNFETLSGYEPLYAGDIVRIATDLVLYKKG